MDRPRCPGCNQHISIGTTIDCGGEDEGWCAETAYAHDLLGGRDTDWDIYAGPPPTPAECFTIWQAHQQAREISAELLHMRAAPLAWTTQAGESAAHAAVRHIQDLLGVQDSATADGHFNVITWQQLCDILAGYARAEALAHG